MSNGERVTSIELALSDDELHRRVADCASLMERRALHVFEVETDDGIAIVQLQHVSTLRFVREQHEQCASD